MKELSNSLTLCCSLFEIFYLDGLHFFYQLERAYLRYIKLLLLLNMLNCLFSFIPDYQFIYFCLRLFFRILTLQVISFFYAYILYPASLAVHNHVECKILFDVWYLTPREKCSNTEFFLVRIFPYSDWILNPYLDTFHAVWHNVKSASWICLRQIAINYFLRFCRFYLGSVFV